MGVLNDESFFQTSLSCLPRHPSSPSLSHMTPCQSCRCCCTAGTGHEGNVLNQLRPCVGLKPSVTVNKSNALTSTCSTAAGQRNVCFALPACSQTRRSLCTCLAAAAVAAMTASPETQMQELANLAPCRSSWRRLGSPVCGSRRRRQLWLKPVVQEFAGVGGVGRRSWRSILRVRVSRE